jgi:ubiquinone biosynthesis protein
VSPPHDGGPGRQNRRAPPRRIRPAGFNPVGHPARPGEPRKTAPRWRVHLTLANLPGIFWRWSRVNFLISLFVVRWLWSSLAIRDPRRKMSARARALRDFLEQAAGAWIKLGQLLAMRSDFFPPEVVETLSSLLDRIPPFPFEVARKIIEEDLGRPLQELFAEFPEKTIAAASFGQVYRAVLPSGDVVAVKVQRPGLQTLIAADVTSLRGLALVVDSLRLLGSLRLKPQVEQLQEILEEELDYEFEAENIRKAVAVSQSLPILRIPGVYEELLSPRVLAMEFLEGRWMNHILARLRNEGEAGREALEDEGLDLRLIAQRMFDIGMRQLFDVRIFHADPHAANIVVVDDNVVGYVDFGIVGTMDDDLAGKQERYFQALKDGRVGDAALAMIEMVEVPRKRRHRLDDLQSSLELRIRQWVDGMKHGTLADKSTARLILNSITLIRELGFNLVEGAMRYYRALIISDVIILQLDPDFDFVQQLRRYFRRRQIRHIRQWMQPDRQRLLLAEYAEMFVNGPVLARKLSDSLRIQREAFEVGSSAVDKFVYGLSLSSLAGFVLVIIARLRHHPDVGVLLSPSFHLDWKWAALGFFVSWRVCALLLR